MSLSLPGWLQPETLPPVRHQSVPISWRDALGRISTSVSPSAAADPDLEGAEEMCAAVVARWLHAPSTPQSEVAALALRALSPARRARCLLEALRGPLGTAQEKGALKLISVLDAVDSPDVWGMLCVAALWTPRPHFAQAIQQALSPRDPDGDWRALLLEQVSENLPLPVGIAGTTAQGAPGSRSYLHHALLEEAMCAGARWSPDRWQARLLPHVAPLSLLTDDADDGHIRILHPAQDEGRMAAAAAALTGEPLAQRGRRVARPSPAEASLRLIRRYRTRSVREVDLWRYLLRRGWARGEVMDIPRVFELYRPLFAWDVCAYVRLYPGILPDHPGESRQQIFGIGFLPGARHKPPWGGYFVQDAAMTEQGPAWAPLGMPLGEVPPVAFSEVLGMVTNTLR